MNLTTTNMTLAEWEVMRIIWTKEQASSSEIISLIQKTKAWSASTIKTLLRRLVTKHYLQTENIGRRFSYRPLITEAEALTNISSEVFSNICATQQGSVIINLLDQVSLNQADIATMQAILSKQAASAPITINCNCIGDSSACDICQPKLTES